MKKVVLGIIAIFLLLVMLYTGYRVNYFKNDNKSLEKKINDIKKDIDTEKENSTKYEEELSKIKEDSNSKEEEYKIWKKAVDKLSKALE